MVNRCGRLAARAPPAQEAQCSQARRLELILIHHLTFNHF
jgi:hypothetical protein